MGELRALPKVEKDTCPWCHPERDCYDKGYDGMSCPRVDALEFLPWEAVHPDDKGEAGWTISAVRFRQPLEFECEILDDEDEA